MSALLGRLVGQSRSTGERGTRIRSAASVHAQVPAGLPTVESSEVPALSDARGFALPRDEHSGTPVVTETRRPPMLAERRAEDAHPGASPVHSHTRTQTIHRREREEHEIVRELSAPAPIMPEVSIPRFDSPLIAPATRPAREASARHDASRGAEATEVHVHIGRIEVIAAPAPATPGKVRAPVRRQSRSLSDYLEGAKRA